MSTVSQEIADKIIAGAYPEDGWVRIIKYDNAWGGVGFGLENINTIGRYSPSEFVKNPQVYWEADIGQF